jgi:hypothetical protein
MNTPHALRSIPTWALVLVLLAVVLSLGACLPATTTPAADPVAVAPVEITEPEPLDGLAPLDAAFLADLYGPGADVTPEQSAGLIYTAHRVCTLLTDPASVPPGAEVPTRESMVETFTADGWTEGQAEHFLDAAAAAYCPELLGLDSAAIL